jgi:N-acetylmuramic acid 6-phosphate etherase
MFSGCFSRLIFFVTTLFFIPAHAACHYHVIIDAGGSSTKLQILDCEGDPLLLKRNGDQPSEEVLGGCMNVTDVGREGIIKVLHELLDDLILDGVSDYPFEDIIPHCTLTFGGAGMGTQQMKDMTEDILVEFGFTKQQLELNSDAELALKLVKDSGGVLISGTGSICFAKEDNRVFRGGGFGWLLGDEGSAYKIGLAAIKKSLEQEYEYGSETAIYEQIKDIFRCELLRPIIGDLQSGKISRKQIASLAPMVFECAHNGDTVCSQILDDASIELGEITAYALKNLENSHPIIYLIGGVFKNRYANSFIKKISNSPSIAQLKKKPIFVNISELNYAVATVREHILSSKDPSGLLISLPFKEGNFKHFSKTCNLEKLTTEKPNRKTQNLSQTFYQKDIEAIKLLHEVDSEVIQGMHEFNQVHHHRLSRDFSECLKSGGRIFFIGAGSSGRVAFNLETKWNRLNSSYKDKVIGLIAGGPRSLIRAKEGFEDSEEAGANSLKLFEINQRDIVVLISASASAKFNIGAGNLALKKGASVFYFYNSNAISSYAEEFMSQPGVVPLLIDIGAQAIRGSTRLQAASIATLCLGSCLNQVMTEVEIDLESEKSLFETYQVNHKLLPHFFEKIAKLVQLELEVFQSPSANFYRTVDENNQGYVTFICNQNATLEVIFDCVETCPTFSLNTVCSLQETEKKSAEYRAYMVSNSNVSNQTAWKMLLGELSSKSDVKDFLISTAAQGNGSYQLRPKGAGNLLIGVLSGTPTVEEVQKLSNELNIGATEGGKTALIAVLSSTASADLKQLAKRCEASVIIDQVGKDFLGISNTLILKEVLNLISNSAMTGMGKVCGNIMIDLNPSNNKLINRSIRIIKEVYAAHHPYKPPLDEELLYHMVIRAFAYKKLMETQHGIHTPPPIRVILTMVEENCSLQEAIKKLQWTKNPQRKSAN